MADGLLEVSVLGPGDAPGAAEGGADRLLLGAGDGAAFSPEPSVVTAVCRASELPVHVVLRLSEGWSTTGGELTRLVGLAEDYLARGAAGVSYGFLDADLEVDTAVCAHLAAALPGVPWVFGRAIDDALDPARSWRRLQELPGLTAVCSAGSPRGLPAGFDDLLEAAADPGVARLLMPGGGLLAEMVPWFVRAGVRRFRVEEQVRPGGSARAYVDAALVRSWRLLLDDALARAAGSAG